MVKEEKQNALFVQRLVAYIIDVLIISFAVSLIAIPFYDSESIKKLDDTNKEVMDKYLNKKIDVKTYVNESIDVGYEIARKNGIVYLLEVFFGIIYFVVYQFYNDGETLGKKFMHIKVMKNDESELTINDLIFRSLIINSIFINIIILCLIIFASAKVYFYGALTIQFIQYIIVIISGLLVMFSKDSRGLHDLVANTKVVRNNSVKELEVCEN